MYIYKLMRAHTVIIYELPISLLGGFGKQTSIHSNQSLLQMNWLYFFSVVLMNEEL